MLVTQAAKELFSLVNLLAGAVLLALLLGYLVLAKPRRSAVVVLLTVILLACLINSLAIYLLY